MSQHTADEHVIIRSMYTVYEILDAFMKKSKELKLT